MVRMDKVKQVLKAMLARYIREYGKISLLPQRKEPLTLQMIEGMLSLPQGTAVGKRRVNNNDWRESIRRAVVANNGQIRV